MAGVLDDAEISRILSITAHPDDVDFAAAPDAVYPDARNPFAFPELRERESLAAWTVREVWIAGGPDPNHYVDVTETFPRKIAALRAHQSQTGHMEDLAERLRTRLTVVAQQAGLPGGRLAEGFRVLDTGGAEGALARRYDRRFC
jgi:LmbE family N-acetylglucosaminyl deacetylase